MAYTERAQLYEKIEAFRKRPLISYVTSLRLNALGLMGADVIPQFIKQLNTISEQHEEVDNLIVSNGGDPIVPWRIINMVRERFPKVGVLLPYVAYSAATLLALGADEIIMHPFSNLGPVDPQLISQRRVPNAGGQGEVETNHFAPEDAR